jgi:alginate O-acetyltransferase complex protein AlgI
MAAYPAAAISEHSKQARRLLMIAFSIAFYIIAAGWRPLIVVIGLSGVAYAAGLSISNSRRRLLLIGAICVMLGTLIYFKYAKFFLVVAFGEVTGADLDAIVSPSFVPLGISFFAFEFCHYLIDVSRGADAVRSPVSFAIFSFFYPRLAAGPITRYYQIIPQFDQPGSITRIDFLVGAQRILSGIFKKFLIADVSANVVQSYLQPATIQLPIESVYLCLFLYLRIYMDFSAYSDFAIGLARWFGVRLPENFNFPFLAASPSDFWRRWHITLSNWVRDYVYIPLGGARVGSIRKIMNLLLAMALVGLWHGAAWGFVLWGVMHGLLLIVSHLVASGYETVRQALKIDKKGISIGLNVVVSCVSWSATQTLVALAWVPFFFPVTESIVVYRKLLAF